MNKLQVELLPFLSHLSSPSLAPCHLLLLTRPPFPASPPPSSSLPLLSCPPSPRPPRLCPLPNPFGRSLLSRTFRLCSPLCLQQALREGGGAAEEILAGAKPARRSQEPASLSRRSQCEAEATFGRPNNHKDAAGAGTSGSPTRGWSVSAKGAVDTAGPEQRWPVAEDVEGRNNLKLDKSGATITVKIADEGKRPYDSEGRILGRGSTCDRGSTSDESRPRFLNRDNISIKAASKVGTYVSEQGKGGYQRAREIQYASRGETGKVGTYVSERGKGGYQRAQESENEKSLNRLPGVSRNAVADYSNYGRDKDGSRFHRRDRKELDWRKVKFGREVSGEDERLDCKRFPCGSQLQMDRTAGAPDFTSVDRSSKDGLNSKKRGTEEGGLWQDETEGEARRDISALSLSGKESWREKVKRKRARVRAIQAQQQADLDYELLGDDWIRKRIGWLCKEIPSLKAAGSVKILNGQRNWIKDEHVKHIIDHLLNTNQVIRASRVHNWMRQQKWYRFDYNWNTKVANVLGQSGKLIRCQDLFDEIIKNAQIPDESTFTILIMAYIEDGQRASIDEAWKLYNQMIKEGMGASLTLKYALLKACTCSTGRWLEQAKTLFNSMKVEGHDISSEMYTRLIEIYCRQGDQGKIDELIQEMKEKRLHIGLDVLNAVLHACAKVGDKEKAENTMKRLAEAGLSPNWRTYVSLIETYGKIGLHMKSWEVFEQMKQGKIPTNFSSYMAILTVMANALERKYVERLLEDVQKSACGPLQPFYNVTMDMYLRLKMYEQVESTFERMKDANARPNILAYNTLIASYVQSAQLEKAESVFERMKKKGAIGPSQKTYNHMLQGYAECSCKEKLKGIFWEMAGKGFRVEPHLRHRLRGVIKGNRIADLDKAKLRLSKDQRETLVGVLLGGAHMESPDRNRTFEFHLKFNASETGAITLKDHLFRLFLSWWKPEQSLWEGEQDLLTGGNETKLISLESINHGSFRFYYHQYRPKGEPAIPKLIHRWLKPRTLAYWYMYGGRKCSRTGGVILNASNYSAKETELVVKALKARTIDCVRKKKRSGFVIRFEGKSAMWLWKLMEPHILEELKEDLRPGNVPWSFKSVRESDDSDDFIEHHGDEVDDGDTDDSVNFFDQFDESDSDQSIEELPLQEQGERASSALSDGSNWED